MWQSQFADSVTQGTQSIVRRLLQLVSSQSTPAGNAVLTYALRKD